MANPVYLLNSVGQRVDCIIAPAGTVLRKMAIGSKVLTGITGSGAWQGVATHVDGDTFAASDGVVAIAGVDGSTVRKILVDSGGRILVAPSRGTFTDHSGSIATGGTHQAVCSSNASRRYFLFENISDTAMWINFGTNAVADEPSILVSAGGSFVMEASFVNTDSVDVICASTGKKYVAKEG